jgi:riboflavin biosynthesis pyrimidine reductase
VRLLTPGDEVASLEDLYAAPGPLLRAGFVHAVDGVIALDGTSAALGSPADKAAFRALRAVCDAVLVGAGTARAEDYGPVLLSETGTAWRAERQLSRPPLVLVSRSLDLDPGARCFTGDTRPLVLTCADATPPRGLADVADLVVAGGPSVDLRAGLDALRARGLSHLLCEGGPGLLTDLLRLGLVDELCLTSAPLLAGEGPRLVGALDEPVRLAPVHLLDGGDGVLLGRYRVLPG